MKNYFENLILTSTNDINDSKHLNLEIQKYDHIVTQEEQNTFTDIFFNIVFVCEVCKIARYNNECWICDKCGLNCCKTALFIYIRIPCVIHVLTKKLNNLT